MKSKVAAVLLSLALASTLGACFGGGESNEEEGGDSIIPTAPGAESGEDAEEAEEGEEDEGGDD